jgi:hypothetical protein
MTKDTFDLKNANNKRRNHRRLLAWYDVIKIFKEDWPVSIDFKGIEREED